MSTRSFSILTLLISMISIQTGASVAKYLFPFVGPIGATGLRLIFATLILWILFRPWKISFSRKQLQGLATYGVALGCMNLLFYMALERIPLGITVALEFTGPLSVALFSSRKPLDFLWAVLAIAGILLVMPLDHTSESLDPVGILLGLGAGVCWGLYILSGRKVGTGIHGGIAAAVGMLFASLVVVPVALVYTGKQLLNYGILPYAIGLAILSSALPYSLEMIALRRLPAKTFGTLMSLEPALGALSGLLFLGENLTLMQWTAIACIMAASAGSAFSTRRDAAATAS